MHIWSYYDNETGSMRHVSLFCIWSLHSTTNNDNNTIIMMMMMMMILLAWGMSTSTFTQQVPCIIICLLFMHACSEASRSYSNTLGNSGHSPRVYSQPPPPASVPTMHDWNLSTHFVLPMLPIDTMTHTNAGPLRNAIRVIREVNVMMIQTELS